MEWIINNWYIVLAFGAVCVVVGVNIKKWFDTPTSGQIESIKKWLLYAVTNAEKELGQKTGKLKLHMVYDMAISKFSWLSFVEFDMFSEWVDEALEEMRSMLSKNEHINAIVNNEQSDQDSE